MDRDSVRKMVQNYIDKNNLSNPELARQAKKLAAACVQPKFAVIGFNSGKVYFRGEHHADCTRWINTQVRTGDTLHTSRKTYLDIDEPMLIQRLSEASYQG